MGNLEKWLVMVTTDQKNWIKQTAEKTGLKGSDVVREMVDRVIKNDAKDFVESLEDAQVRIELESVERAKQELLSRERELKQRLSGKTKVAA